ncbi:MAG: nucleotidyltransferase domain-containing protein [Thermofilaceae archaeon]
MAAEKVEKLQEPYRSILLELVRALQRRLGSSLVSVVVFGSVARGEARRDSDIDLLIVVEGLPRSRFRRQDIFMEVEGELQPLIEEAEKLGYTIEFSPILKTPEEAARGSPLYLDMVEDAVILYDKGGFFQGILKRLAKRLEALGAERVKYGKLWYWRLKRDYRFGEVIEL